MGDGALRGQQRLQFLSRVPFAAILQKPWAKYIGIIGVIVPVVIYMYYVFIESWCLGYAVKFWTGGNLHLKDASESAVELLRGLHRCRIADAARR
jgi:SNF family Na+-dependent transporter